MGDEYYAIQHTVLSAWPRLQSGRLSSDPETAEHRLAAWMTQMTPAQRAVIEHALEHANLPRDLARGRRRE